MRSPIPLPTIDLEPAASAADPSLPDPQLTADLPVAPTRWQSSQLLGQAKEVAIDHAGQVYRLRVTALGKLILTK